VIRTESITSGFAEGICKMGKRPVVAAASLHKWEEPCISGDMGSGTVFFSGCSLKCVFCQNYKISTENYGKEVSIEELSHLYLKLIQQGAHNINLVNPTHFIEAISEALEKPLAVPVVYNSSGYENISSLKMLKNKVQIYLPDLKYSDNVLASKYSKAKDYFEVATEAILAMYQQVGNYEFDDNGMLKKGVMIRHLILPNHIENTFKVIDWIKEHFDKGTVLFSLMSQYIPYGEAYLYPEINRKLTKKEYSKVENYLFDSGLEEGYIQDPLSAKDTYIPSFNLENIE
jgi:putative pyruvate formate lyase activating enzyme